MSKGLFLVGTGTDIGKTYVAGLIVKKIQKAGYSSSYYKAAMSGNVKDTNGHLIPGDAKWVQQVSGISQPLDTMCPFVYEHAYSPHLASRIEGNPVTMAKVLEGYKNVCASYDYVTMEGSGGILCPIDYDTERIQLEDVIRACNLPCLLIADAGLGTINSVVLTVEYMRSHNLALSGIVYNNFHPGNIMEEDNIHMCEEMTKVPTIAVVEPNATDLELPVEKLLALYQ